MALACRHNFLVKYEYKVVAEQWYETFCKFKDKE